MASPDRARVCLLCLTFLLHFGCGSEEAAEAITVEPAGEPSTESNDSSEGAAPTSPEEAPALAETAPTVADESELEPSAETQPSGGPTFDRSAPFMWGHNEANRGWGRHEEFVGVTPPQHPDPNVRRQLWAVLRATAAATMRDDLNFIMEGDGPPANCDVVSIRHRMLTVRCKGELGSDRGVDGTFFQHTSIYEVVDSSLRPVPLASLVTSLDALREAVSSRCLTSGGDNACLLTREEEITFAAQHMVMTYPLDDYYEHVQVPYSALRAVLRRDSALTRALPDLVAEAPGWVPPEETADGTAFGPSRGLGDAVHAWAELPDAVRTQVGLLAVAPGLLRLAIASTDATRVRAIASASHAAAEAIHLPGPVVAPRWARVHRDINVRLTPETHAFAAMPQGMLVLTWPGNDRSVDLPARWQRVGLSPDLDGLAATRYLRADPECVPSANAFVDSLPEDQRSLARRTLWRGVATLRRHRAPVRAAWFAAEARRDHVVFAIHELDQACEVGERWANWRTQGQLREVAFTNDAEQGQTLGALATYLRGEIRWQLFRKNDREAAWTQALPSPNWTLLTAQTPWDQGDEWSPLAFGDRQVRMGETEIVDVPRQGRAP